MKLIYADDALEAVEQAIINHDSAIMRIVNLPAAVDDAKHGGWVEVFDESGEADLMCSVCGERQDGYFGYWNYCPNCGAKMDGGEG